MLSIRYHWYIEFREAGIVAKHINNHPDLSIIGPQWAVILVEYIERIRFQEGNTFIQYTETIEGIIFVKHLAYLLEYYNKFPELHPKIETAYQLAGLDGVRILLESIE